MQVALAKELGLCYAALALATDYDCWRESNEPVSVEMVIKTFKKNAEKAINILQTAIPKLAKSNWAEASTAALVNKSNGHGNKCICRQEVGQSLVVSLVLEKICLMFKTLVKLPSSLKYLNDTNYTCIKKS